jgi:hypothetical protein
MIRVVIESPYAGDIEKNEAYARACMRQCIKQGEAPIASHLIYTQPGILDENNPTERKLGIELGYEWMHYADVVLFYVDHGWSPGMLKALEHATRVGKPIEVRRL